MYPTGSAWTWSCVEFVMYPTGSAWTWSSLLFMTWTVPFPSPAIHKKTAKKFYTCFSYSIKHLAWRKSEIPYQSLPMPFRQFQSVWQSCTKRIVAISYCMHSYCPTTKIHFNIYIFLIMALPRTVHRQSGRVIIARTWSLVLNFGWHIDENEVTKEQLGACHSIPATPFLSSFIFRNSF